MGTILFLMLIVGLIGVWLAYNEEIMDELVDDVDYFYEMLRK